MKMLPSFSEVNLIRDPLVSYSRGMKATLLSKLLMVMRLWSVCILHCTLTCEHTELFSTTSVTF